MKAEEIRCQDVNPAASSAQMRYLLARAYEKGACGIAQDPARAMQTYRQAAEHGHMLAQYRLGEMNFTGTAGATDFPEAKKWFLLAAEQGHGLSQLRLAFLNAEAHFKGLTVDYAEAEKWFLKAAEQDAGDARFRLGNFYHNYKNPPELEKAVYWLTRAAEGGHRVAMFDLARLLRKGEGAPADAGKALAWMTSSAKLGFLSAQMTLSEMYATGDGVPEDPATSLFWTLKVAEAPTAIPFWINKAGDVYFTGWGSVPRDYARAAAFYQRAADKNDAHALARLGLMYQKGLGVKRDPAKGRRYLVRAADLGSLEAGGLLLGKKQK